ncbi:MAG: polysaccharide biosynthesis/export family protein [Planctomycetota bacterium]
MTRCFSWLCLMVCLAAAIPGCRHARHTDYAAFVREPRPTVAGLDYRLGVPDRLAVTVASSTETHETQHTLGPTGRLLVPGFRPVLAPGLTCQDLADRLKDAALEPDTAQHVTVRVTEFASQDIFVFGQVRTPGPQPYHGANSVLDAVAHAAPNPRALTTHIQVLRPSPHGDLRRRLTVDLDAIIRDGDTTLDVVLDPGDVVFVPATPLGTLGLAWEQLFPPTPADRPGPAAHPTPPPALPSPPAPVETRTAETPSEDAPLAELTAELRALRMATAAYHQALATALAQARSAPEPQATAGRPVVFINPSPVGRAPSAPRDPLATTNPRRPSVPPPADFERPARVFGEIPEAWPGQKEQGHPTTDSGRRGGGGESGAPRDAVRFWGP